MALVPLYADALSGNSSDITSKEATVAELLLLCVARPPPCAIIGDHCLPEFHHCFDHLADAEREQYGLFCPFIITAFCVCIAHLTYSVHFLVYGRVLS